MAFLKNMWKNNSRHKKLSEEWALATSLTDFTKNYNDIEDQEPISFNVKYLGNKIVDAARSEEATADAVKQVINSAKPNWKKLQRVSLYVSPKGIEMCDTLSGETLMQVSIYKISYCSADAAHSQVFAFINSTDDNSSSKDNDSCASGSSDTESSTSSGVNSSKEDGTLILHAFLCQKRKIAQNVTLTVAKSFEMAFQLWQDDHERRSKNSNSNKKNNIINYKSNGLNDSDENNSLRNMLIDFNSEISAELCSKDKQYFQNTWVSFEDEKYQSETIQNNYPTVQNLWDANNMIYS